MRAFASIVAVAAAATIFGASGARADYCRTIPCAKSDGAPGTKTQCCNDPNSPPSTPQLCGQFVAGTTNVVGGCSRPDGTGSGCFGDSQPDGSPCGETAAAWCVACGCFHETFCE